MDHKLVVLFTFACLIILIFSYLKLISDSNKQEWEIAVFRNMHCFCLGIHIQRWNKGDEWRIYLLFWEIDISKLQ